MTDTSPAEAAAGRTVIGDPIVDARPASVAAQFLERVRATPGREAFRWPAGERWQSATWSEIGERVGRLAAGLLALGLEPGQTVGIIAGTRIEWILADMANMCAGGATTTVYPSTMAADVAYILADAGCVHVFAENATQLAKLTERRHELPAIKTVILIDGDSLDDWTITLSELEARGRAFLAEHPDAVEAAAAALRSGDLATLIYTSGTTGRPKGVRLTHEAWTYEGSVIAAMDVVRDDDLQYLWLPLSHSFGKVLLTAQLACGYATAVDGRVDKIIDNLAIVRPTFMGAAPRIFEKAHAKVVTTSQAGGGLKAKLFQRAFKVGIEAKRREREGRPLSPVAKLELALYDRLVFSKVRAVFGGRIRCFISGAAPLNRDIAEWFEASGLLILEGYGLTETSAASFVNRLDNYKLGTVGLPLPGTEVKLGENNEVLLRGPGVMVGYHNLPEQTHEALGGDGWFHTGDQGALDADGFLTITGRTKELFKTSGGKYIAPPAIEGSFKAICPYVSQFQVFGHAQKYCVALVTLDADAIVPWAGENGLGGRSYAEIASSEQAEAMVGGYVEQLNAQLNRWETIKKWAILDHDLSVESGELTPSLKVKRAVVEDNNRELLDRLFAG